MNKRLAWSIFRYVLSMVVLLVVALGAFIYWAVGGNLPKRSALSVEQVENPESWPVPDVLTVVSYNIGHGQGIKENAWDYRDKNVTVAQLSAVADAMANMDADIFLLQEVDIDSHRTSRINQIEFIKARTKHPYHACSMVWEKNYLPFPYWPPAHHIGYVRAANCILSRFPLSNHERIIFDKPASNPFWYNWGYLDRGIQRVDVNVGGHKLALLNIHFEAWERDAREKQALATLNYLNEVTLPVILGGDLNTVPQGAPKTDEFADDPGVNYLGETTIPTIEEKGVDIKIAVLDPTQNLPNQRFTFPADQPDRRLDHIYLFGKNLAFVDFRVVNEAGTASDHLPVMAKVKYK